jgi:3alpha(or 20beta)-hydroxysteroid dehydrogenase
VEQEFFGRNIVVTGAASGMGRAQALALSREGAKVWLTDIADGPGRALADEIDAGGGSARFVSLDVRDPQAWELLRDRVNDEDGRLHGLVNNAGVSHRFGIADTTIEDWHRVMDINLSSIFYGMKALFPLLRECDSASVVNISSCAGMIGYPAAAYCASKWGVRGLTKVAALEFAEWGTRVNSIHPGLIETPLLRSGSERFAEESVKYVPAGRLGQADEIADAVRYLLSDGSKYVNGTELVIDGGMTSGGLFHRISHELSDFARR